MRFKPRTAGLKAQTLPLGHAVTLLELCHLNSLGWFAKVARQTVSADVTTLDLIGRIKVGVLPDVLVPLDVDLVELTRHRRDDVLLHLQGHVLRQHRQQESLLKSRVTSGVNLRQKLERSFIGRLQNETNSKLSKIPQSSIEDVAL